MYVVIKTEREGVAVHTPSAGRRVEHHFFLLFDSLH